MADTNSIENLIDYERVKVKNAGKDPDFKNIKRAHMIIEYLNEQEHNQSARKTIRKELGFDPSEIHAALQLLQRGNIIITRPNLRDMRSVIIRLSTKYIKTRR